VDIKTLKRLAGDFDI